MNPCPTRILLQQQDSSGSGRLHWMQWRSIHVGGERTGAAGFHQRRKTHLQAVLQPRSTCRATLTSRSTDHSSRDSSLILPYTPEANGRLSPVLPPLQDFTKHPSEFGLELNIRVRPAHWPCHFMAGNSVTPEQDHSRDARKTKITSKPVPYIIWNLK
jgi:hypothetical protein